MYCKERRFANSMLLTLGFNDYPDSRECFLGVESSVYIDCIQCNMNFVCADRELYSQRQCLFQFWGSEEVSSVWFVLR